MKTKLFEIRDRMTMIAAVGIEVSRDDGPLARRAGYGDPCILFTRLDGGKSNYDPFEWGDRTWHVAHRYVAEHWSELESGAVIDVEFILGETQRPKVSECAR